MNKKSIIAIVMALSLILVGTGYAYWTDTLNVTTKATTGDLDVTFLDLALYAQYGNEYQDGTAAEANWSIIDGIGATGYVAANFFNREDAYNQIALQSDPNAAYQERAAGMNNVDFNAEYVDPVGLPKTVGPYLQGEVDSSKNIVLTLNNIYPGFAQAFRTDIANVGSIAAMLGNINFKVTALENEDLNATTKNMLGVAVLIEREQYSGSETGGVTQDGANVFELAKLFDASEIFTLGNVDFVRLSALNKLTTDEFIDANNRLLLMPNDNRMDLYIGVAMDPDAEGVYTTGSTAVMSKKDDTKSENKGAQIIMNLLWDQFNAGQDVDATNRLSEQNR